MAPPKKTGKGKAKKVEKPAAAPKPRASRRARSTSAEQPAPTRTTRARSKSIDPEIAKNGLFGLPDPEHKTRKRRKGRAPSSRASSVAATATDPESDGEGAQAGDVKMTDESDIEPGRDQSPEVDMPSTLTADIIESQETDIHQSSEYNGSVEEREESLEFEVISEVHASTHTSFGAVIEPSFHSSPVVTYPATNTQSDGEYDDGSDQTGDLAPPQYPHLHVDEYQPHELSTVAEEEEESTYAHLRFESGRRFQATHGSEGEDDGETTPRPHGRASFYPPDRYAIESGSEEQSVEEADGYSRRFADDEDIEVEEVYSESFEEREEGMESEFTDADDAEEFDRGPSTLDFRQVEQSPYYQSRARQQQGAISIDSSEDDAASNRPTSGRLNNEPIVILSSDEEAEGEQPTSSGNSPAQAVQMQDSRDQAVTPQPAVDDDKTIDVYTEAMAQQSPSRRPAPDNGSADDEQAEPIAATPQQTPAKRPFRRPGFRKRSPARTPVRRFGFQTSTTPLFFAEPGPTPGTEAQSDFAQTREEPPSSPEEEDLRIDNLKGWGVTEEEIQRGKYNILVGRFGCDPLPSFSPPPNSPFLPDATSTPRVYSLPLSSSPQATLHTSPTPQTVIVTCPTQASGPSGGLVCSCKQDDKYSQAEVFNLTAQVPNKYSPYIPLFHVVRITPPQTPHAHPGLEVNPFASEPTAQEKQQARLNLARQIDDTTDQPDDNDDSIMMDSKVDQEMSGSEESEDGEQMEIEQHEGPPAQTPGGILSTYLSIFATPVKKLIFGSSSQKTPVVSKTPSTPSTVKAQKPKRPRRSAQTEPRLRSRPADFEKLADLNNSIAAIPILDFVPNRNQTPSSSSRAAALRVPPSPQRNTNASSLRRSRPGILRKRRASDSVGATFSVPGYPSAAKKARIDNDHLFGGVPDLAASTRSTIGHDPVPGQPGYHSATELPPPNSQGYLPESVRNAETRAADTSAAETHPFGGVSTADSILGDNNAGAITISKSPSKGFGLDYGAAYYQDSTTDFEADPDSESVTEMDQDVEELNRLVEEEKRWEDKPFHQWTQNTAKAFMAAPFPDLGPRPSDYDPYTKEVSANILHGQYPPLFNDLGVRPDAFLNEEELMMHLGLSPYDFLWVERARGGFQFKYLKEYYDDGYKPRGTKNMSPKERREWKMDEQRKCRAKYEQAIGFWKADPLSKHDKWVEEMTNKIKRDRESLKRKCESLEQEEQEQMARHKERMDKMEKEMEKQLDERRRTLEAQMEILAPGTSGGTIPNPFGSSLSSPSKPATSTQTAPAWTQAPPPPPSPAHASLPQSTNLSNQIPLPSVEGNGHEGLAPLAIKNMNREKQKANRYAPKTPSNLRDESHLSSPVTATAPAISAPVTASNRASAIASGRDQAGPKMTASDFGSDDSRTLFFERLPTPPSIPAFGSHVQLKSVAAPTSLIQKAVDDALAHHPIGIIPAPKIPKAFSYPPPGVAPEEDEVL